MTIRDQLHDLIDALGDDPTKSTLHANIDELPDDDLPETLDRLYTFRSEVSNTAGPAGVSRQGEQTATSAFSEGY